MGQYIGSAAIILDEAGRVLMVHHSYGHLNWEIPGGGSEPGESAIETAIREVREETGLEVGVERMTGIYWDTATDSHHFAFRAHQVDPSAKPVADGAEITELGFFSPDALPRPISDFTLLRITDALAGSRVDLPKTVGPRQWVE